MMTCRVCGRDVSGLVRLSGCRCTDCCTIARDEALARAPMVEVLAQALVRERLEHSRIRERLANKLVGFDLSADEAWMSQVMCRVALPVPVREVAEILRVMSILANKDGMEARCEQRGDHLEIFKIAQLKGGQ